VRRAHMAAFDPKQVLGRGTKLWYKCLSDAPFRKQSSGRETPALPLTEGVLMDLNYLYHRHGVSLIMAANAACRRSGEVHRSLAAAYASRIASTIRGNEVVSA